MCFAALATSTAGLIGSFYVENLFCINAEATFEFLVNKRSHPGMCLDLKKKKRYFTKKKKEQQRCIYHISFVCPVLCDLVRCLFSSKRQPCPTLLLSHFPNSRLTAFTLTVTAFGRPLFLT